MFCVQVPTPSMSWGCGSISSEQLGMPTQAVVSCASFFFTHYVVCAGTTQWQPHHGDTTSSCHMAVTATHSRALLHNMLLPDGNMGGSTPQHNTQLPNGNTTAVQQMIARPLQQHNSDAGSSTPWHN